MPAERGPDGTSSDPPHDRNEPTRRLDRRGLASSSGLADTVPPRVVTPHQEPPRTALIRDERTQLAGPRRAEPAVASEITDNPVVGWLVVVEGPGRGQARTIGYGMNGIGRGPDQRISLDFGDQQMSRVSHAVLSYDPRSRKFFLQHGGGANLTYLNGQLVLSPQPIDSGSAIIIGRTKLRFVALCGPDFDWQDE